MSCQKLSIAIQCTNNHAYNNTSRNYHYNHKIASQKRRTAKTMYAAINATIEIIVAAVTIREGVLSSVYNQTVLKLIISIMDK